MSIQALSEYTFQSRYSQFNYDKNRKEIWSEAVDRIFDMHREKYKEQIEASDELKNAVVFAQKQYEKKRTLGSQRALQYGGSPILDKNERLYNCTGTLIDKPKAFQDIVFVLMAGCGAGYSVQKHHVKKLPKITKRSNSTKKFVIPDSCEGWADSVGVLLSSFFSKNTTFPEYKNKKVVFDFSKIRPKGALIAKRFKAPGSEPLKNGLIKIEKLLEDKIKANQDRLSPLDCHDIICHAADFVISAGLRRSALISLFSENDLEMAACKTGNWFIDNPQRARANNSVVINRNDISFDDYKEIMKNVREYGEPGVYFCEDPEFVSCNPCCVSENTLVHTTKGIKTAGELVGKEFTTIINGKHANSSEEGFFESGSKVLWEVSTQEGFSVEVTNDHRFMSNGQWIELKDLNIGDVVEINNPGYNTWEGYGEKEQGWLIGSYLGDGTSDQNQHYLQYWGQEESYMPKLAAEYLTNAHGQCDISEYKSVNINGVKSTRVKSNYLTSLINRFDILSNKNINKNIWSCSSNFCEGLLKGWFDADGSVQGNQNKGISVRLCSTNLNNLKIAQQILQKIGIFSKIYTNREDDRYKLMPDGKGAYKQYLCKAWHDLVISNESIVKFNEYIGFNNKEKQNKLIDLISQYKRSPNKDKFQVTINSIKLLEEKKVYDCTVPSTSSFDGNGFLLHNCEIGFWPQLENGDTGMSFCNLTDINGGYCDTPEKFYEQCEASAIIGTLQAGYNSFPYLGETTEKIVQHESLLGCSITGWMSNPHIFFDEKILKNGVKIIKKTNEKIAKLIGINPAARLTCAKPSGSTSCILSTSSGIHPHHARRYIRRVQSNKQDSALQHFKKFNPNAVENSVWDANNSDEVISFICEVPPGSIVKNQLSAIDFLEKVKFAQKNWVLPGTIKNRGLNPDITHNISNTIIVQQEEWDEVEKYIYDNREYFSGISLLPSSGDLDYAQAPFSTVLTPNELVKEYGDAAVFASGLITAGLEAFDDLWLACNCALGIDNSLDNEKPKEPQYPKTRNYKDLAKYFEEREAYDKHELKKDWVRRLKQFAQRYFDNNERKATYCCKHVFLWKSWCDLSREYQNVNWESMDCGPEFTDADTLSGQACSGGACEIV